MVIIVLFLTFLAVLLGLSSTSIFTGNLDNLDQGESCTIVHLIQRGVGNVHGIKGTVRPGEEGRDGGNDLVAEGTSRNCEVFESWSSQSIEKQTLGAPINSIVK
ncbi:hypothetical protein C8J57DRAFT_1248049 [Mycena rebaudengoi]|nr:hypothetical protein C8J57DRAFT_1248049 [Mycena rebaudengoi]